MLFGTTCRIELWRLWGVFSLLLGLTPTLVIAAAVDGRLTVRTLDEETGGPIAVRMELRDARGRVVRLRPKGAIVAGESIYFDGETTLELRRGAYTFLIEAGPEFRTRPGNFTIDRHAEDSTDITLLRRVNMRDEGWLAGDLDVQTTLAHVLLMMRARSVDFVPVTGAVNDDGRCRKAKPSLPANAGEAADRLYGPWAALDDRRGGALLAIAGDQSLDVCQWKADESSLPMLTVAREAGAVVVAISPTAWDFPLWVASGKLDAVQVINRFSQPGVGAAASKAARPRDNALFGGKLGPGRYSESIYHHLLNCGLRLPPAAGSGAVTDSNPRQPNAVLGSSRVYVHCEDEQCTRDAWLAGLKAGRVVVTNGPLLRTRVEGRPPGEIFSIETGETREFQIALGLAFYDQTQVEYLEIIQNGMTMHHVRLAELAEQEGRLPPVKFEGSGWFLVRAITNNPELYQFASTGPYYVEADYQPRISRASVEYFIKWLDDAAEQFAKNEAVLADIEAARPFWNKLLAAANAE